MRWCFLWCLLPIAAFAAPLPTTDSLAFWEGALNQAKQATDVVNKSFSSIEQEFAQIEHVLGEAGYVVERINIKSSIGSYIVRMGSPYFTVTFKKVRELDEAENQALLEKYQHLKITEFVLKTLIQVPKVMEASYPNMKVDAITLDLSNLDPSIDIKMIPKQ